MKTSWRGQKPDCQESWNPTGRLALWILRTNNYTKAAVPMLSKFSKHRSTSSSKLFMKSWHCIFNAIVKESALKRHFIFHFCICLRNFVAAFDTICAFHSSVKLFHRHPWKCSTDILPERSIRYTCIYLFCKLLAPDLFQQIVSKLWRWEPLPNVDCRDSQDLPDKHHFEPAPILVSSILTL